jgi:hypothetical protein
MTAKKRANQGASGLNRDASRLTRLSLSMTASGSQIERVSWQTQLQTAINNLFSKKQNDTLEQALDYLWIENPPACDALAELIENHAETLTEQATFDAILLAVPLLAWSRYTISGGRVNRQRLQSLQELLQEHILATGTRLSMADILYSPDQLPQGFIETRAMLQQLVTSAISGLPLTIDTKNLPPAGEYVADVRYLFAAVLVDKNSPIFRWQQTDITLDEALQTWQGKSMDLFRELLPGCHLKLLLPNAFFNAWRRLEDEARPFSVRAAIQYLCETLQVLPAELFAVVSACYDQTLEEYRIGFGLVSSPQILHGVVWPLIGNEQEDGDTLSHIERELSDLGKVTILTSTMPMEYCEDCGTPLFPNPQGELQHPEMPENSTDIPKLH